MQGCRFKPIVHMWCDLGWTAAGARSGTEYDDDEDGLLMSLEENTIA